MTNSSLAEIKTISQKGHLLRAQSHRECEIDKEGERQRERGRGRETERMRERKRKRERRLRENGSSTSGIQKGYVRTSSGR